MDKKKNFETEMDFKELPKSPSRLFGWIFPYYAILFVIVGIYFVKNMDSASFNNVPANYTDSLEITANVEVKKGGIMPAIDLGIISNPTPEIVENGKTLFGSNCSSCHGTEGKGDGVAAAAIVPPPRNFHEVEGWKNGREFNGLYLSLQKGIPGTSMMAYEYLSVEDRIAIIHYIRTLSDYPSVNEASVAELDKTYELSKGINTPSNITLEMATDKITDEAGIILSNVDNVISRINSVEDKNIVDLFNKHVDDKEKVISIFRRDFSSEKNADRFVNRIISFPTESGFKSNASLLSKDKLNSLFELLSSSAS